MLAWAQENQADSGSSVLTITPHLSTIPRELKHTTGGKWNEQEGFDFWFLVGDALLYDRDSAVQVIGGASTDGFRVDAAL
jgi:hypothetical protein